MCCDFELELLSKPMTASNIRCLFDSRSPGPITYNEAWTSMFDKHQLYPIPALSLLEVSDCRVHIKRMDAHGFHVLWMSLPSGYLFLHCQLYVLFTS